MPVFYARLNELKQSRISASDTSVWKLRGGASIRIKSGRNSILINGLGPSGFLFLFKPGSLKKMGVGVGPLNRSVLKEFATFRPAFVKLHAGTQLHV